MGILNRLTNNKEQALQNELDSVNILLTQKELEVKKLKSQIKQLKDKSQEKIELTMQLEDEIEHLNELVNEKQKIEVELKTLKEEKNVLLMKIENLLNRIKKKDDSIKKEQEIKNKYRYYFEHGAMDFSKAIAFFNKMTDNNLSETKVRTFLIQNNIIYKAGRYYAPTPYAKDFNYIVVYGENGATAPKYTIEFLLYLKQMVDDEQL